MATLYEMTAEIAELYDALQNSELDDETIDEVINTHLEGIGATEKVEGCCQVIKQLTNDAAMFEAEEKRCKERKTATKNRIERIKKALLLFMQSSGNSKFKAGTFSVSIGTSQSVTVFDEKAIPVDYLIPQPPKVNKTEIGKALKAGVEIPGCELATNEGVRIR